VTKTMLGTTLTNSSDVDISTVEHLMAGLWGAGVDNVIVEVDAPEIPIMDGSSQPFIAMVEKAGLKTQKSFRKILRIKDEVEVGDKKRSAKFLPADHFTVKFKINFNDNIIGKQRARYEFAADTFKQEIAAARTFGFKHEVEAMHAAGLALGGSLDNAIVVGEDGILNDDGLRFEDEFVRHKILDSIGDLFLFGMRIQGEFIGHRSGHSTNNEILHTLIANPRAWEVIDPTTERPLAPVAAGNFVYA